MKLTKSQSIAAGVFGQGLPDARKRAPAKPQRSAEEQRKRNKEERERNAKRAKRAEEQRKKEAERQRKKKMFDRAMSKTKGGSHRRKEDGSYYVDTGRRFT